MKSREFNEKIREKSVAELQEELASLKEEQFNLKMQLSLGQLESNQRVKTVRRNIARVRTVIAEKQNAEKEV